VRRAFWYEWDAEKGKSPPTMSSHSFCIFLGQTAPQNVFAAGNGKRSAAKRILKRFFCFSTYEFSLAALYDQRINGHTIFLANLYEMNNVKYPWGTFY
jgi:hypothetical protein